MSLSSLPGCLHKAVDHIFPTPTTAGPGVQEMLTHVWMCERVKDGKQRQKHTCSQFTPVTLLTVSSFSSSASCLGALKVKVLVTQSCLTL